MFSAQRLLRRLNCVGLWHQVASPAPSSSNARAHPRSSTSPPTFIPHTESVDYVFPFPRISADSAIQSSVSAVRSGTDAKTGLWSGPLSVRSAVLNFSGPDQRSGLRSWQLRTAETGPRPVRTSLFGNSWRRKIPNCATCMCLKVVNLMHGLSVLLLPIAITCSFTSEDPLM
jgi:hypothetical protein